MEPEDPRVTEAAQEAWYWTLCTVYLNEWRFDSTYNGVYWRLWEDEWVGCLVESFLYTSFAFVSSQRASSLAENALQSRSDQSPRNRNVCRSYCSAQHSTLCSRTTVSSSEPLAGRWFWDALRCWVRPFRSVQWWAQLVILYRGCICVTNYQTNLSSIFIWRLSKWFF